MAVKMPAGSTKKALFRSEDLERLQTAFGKKFELVRGELYEVMPTSQRHGTIVIRTGRKLDEWAERTGAGQISGDSGYILERDPDTVRGPDIAFVRKGRLKARQSRRGFPELAPDLAIEIRSPNETWVELAEKAREYFAAGCRMGWFVEIDAFLELVWPNGERKRLGLDEPVEVDDVLPGFRCKVRDFFPEEI